MLSGSLLVDDTTTDLKADPEHTGGIICLVVSRQKGNWATLVHLLSPQFG